MKRSLAAVLLVLSAVGCSDDPANWPRSEFTPKAWAASPYDQRYVYVRDLIDNQRLVGKSFDEVEAMLGQPEDRNDKERRLAYVVKKGSATSMNFIELLDIRADENGRVSKVFVRGD